MTNQEAIMQLNNLEEHCKDMLRSDLAYGADEAVIWATDIEALEMAIQLLEEKEMRE